MKSQEGKKGYLTKEKTASRKKVGDNHAEEGKRSKSEFSSGSASVQQLELDMEQQTGSK